MADFKLQVTFLGLCALKLRQGWRRCNCPPGGKTPTYSPRYDVPADQLNGCEEVHLASNRYWYGDR